MVDVGSELNKPSWSVTIMSLLAFVMIATIADSLSLSPNLSSSVATISFSLIIGIMPVLGARLALLLCSQIEIYLLIHS